MKKKLIFFTFAIFVLAIALRLPYITRQFTLEEAFHARVIKTIQETGFPLVYKGEQQELTVFGDRPPTLFLFFLIPLSVFPDSEWAFRITPLFFSILELLVLFLFGKKLFGQARLWPAIPLALFFISIHTFAIQTSTQIHFDQIFSFFSTLFLFFALTVLLQKDTSTKKYFLLGLLFFFAFSIKYDPSLVLILIVSVGAFIHFRRFLPGFLVTCTVSASLFLIIYYFYNLQNGSPQTFWVPIELILGVFKSNVIPKLAENQTTKHLWAENYYILIRFLSWLGIPTLLLGFYSLIHILKSKLYQDPKILFLLIWVAIYTISYLAVGWSGDYPRYFAPILTPLFILISIVLTDNYLTLQKKLTAMTILIPIIFSIVLLFALSYNGFLFLDRISGWVPHLQIPFFTILISACAIIFILARKASGNLFLTISLVFLALAHTTLSNLHDQKSQYSLTNFYEVSGGKEAGIFLKNNLPKNSIILTYDPVSYYYKGIFYDYPELISGRYVPKDLLLDVITQNKISAIALPSVYVQELDRITNENGIDFEKLTRERFKNHQTFGKGIKTEVFY